VKYVSTGEKRLCRGRFPRSARPAGQPTRTPAAPARRPQPGCDFRPAPRSPHGCFTPNSSGAGPGARSTGRGEQARGFGNGSTHPGWKERGTGTSPPAPADVLGEGPTCEATTPETLVTAEGDPGDGPSRDILCLPRVSCCSPRRRE